MVGSNYPPGTSHRDLVRGGIIEPHDHEHNFEPVGENPIIEDGAAIFFLECDYAEGEYGQGYRCEKTQSKRFEYSRLTAPDGSSIELPEISEIDQLADHFQVMIEMIETNIQDIDVDPDLEDGQVTVFHNDWEIKYEP